MSTIKRVMGARFGSRFRPQTDQRSGMTTSRGPIAIGLQPKNIDHLATRRNPSRTWVRRCGNWLLRQRDEYRKSMAWLNHPVIKG